MIWLLLAKVAIVVALGGLAVLAGGHVVVATFRLAERPQPAPDPATSTETAPPLADAAKVLRGGAWIGMLERLAIFATVLAGFPEGLAVALALKGLARYPELKATTSGAAERFIIGTFVSVLVAAGCAGLAAWLIRLF